MPDTEKRPQGKRETREAHSAKQVEESDEQPETDEDAAVSAYDGADPVGWDKRTHGAAPSERPETDY